MTDNQIAYWQLLEARRSHKASEEIATKQLAETARHNFEQERETRRHNLVTADISAQSLVLTGKKDAETARHNLESEAISRENLAGNLALGYANLAENVRSHQASESISWAGLAESERSHRAQEALTAQQIAEANRHNLASEQMAIDTLTESERHNRVNELVARANANISSRQAAAAERNAAVNERQASVAERNATVREEELNLAKLESAERQVLLHEQAHAQLIKNLWDNTYYYTMQDAVMRNLNAQTAQYNANAAAQTWQASLNEAKTSTEWLDFMHGGLNGLSRLFGLN